MQTYNATLPASNNDPIDPKLPPPGFYVPSDIKRFRRTKAEVTDIRKAISDILSADNPQTVRQVFYALTVRGVIKKDEMEYQRTVVRLLAEMREAGDIPFEWLADNTSWLRKPTTFIRLEACLKKTANSTGAISGQRCRPTSRSGARRTHSPAY